MFKSRVAALAAALGVVFGGVILAATPANAHGASTVSKCNWANGFAVSPPTVTVLDTTSGIDAQYVAQQIEYYVVNPSTYEFTMLQGATGWSYAYVTETSPYSNTFYDWSTGAPVHGGANIAVPGDTLLAAVVNLWWWQDGLGWVHNDWEYASEPYCFNEVWNWVWVPY